MERRKLGFICVFFFSNVRFTVPSEVFFSFLHSSILRMHFNLSCVAHYSDWNVTGSWGIWEARRLPGMLHELFPVPDGQTLLLLSSVLEIACVESVWLSAYTVCREMKSLQTEGRRMRMGSLNAIVFSCGTVTTYLTGVDVQRQACKSPQKSNMPPFSLVPTSLHMSLANWNIGINWMENHSDPNAYPNFFNF